MKSDEVDRARAQGYWDGLNDAGVIAGEYDGLAAVTIASRIMIKRGECGCAGEGTPHWHNNSPVVKRPDEDKQR